ncbi:MAG: protein kinase [Pirellulales bacterium]
MGIDQADFCPPSAADSVEAATEIVRRFSRTLWLDLVRRDQSERWRSGVGVPAERYFQLLPELRQESEDALILVCGEARCRCAAGQRPSLAEYVGRFPELAGELAIQFELDETFGNLSGNPGETPQRDPSEFQLPGFEILREFGRGASGVVYLARQISMSRQVAVKVTDAWIVDEKHLSRHRQEASILSRLKHPNIVQIHDVVEAHGMLASIIEYVDGPTLAEFIGGRPQVPYDAVQLVLVLAKAVHAVHEAGILHRDLKPSNVLLTAGGEPKITDFGLAKLLSNASLLTTHQCLLGTPSYMSPEQAASDNCGALKEGDVYSLGAILYELLTGRPPFLGVTILDTLSMIRDRDPIPPHTLQPRTPRDLETICLKCLAKSPQDRYRTAAALAEDLGRFLAGAPIVARRPAWHERAARWCRRNPMIAALAACLMVTGGAGFLGVVGQWRQAEHARSNEAIARHDADDRARQLNEGLEHLKLANGFLARGHDFLAARRWDDADAAFTRAIDLRPDHVQAWEARGEFLYARLGLWDLAAADLARSFELQRPNVTHRWWWNALLRVYMGDVAAYCHICTEVEGRFGKNDASGRAFDLVRTLCLAPHPGANPERSIELAEAMASCYPENGFFVYLHGVTLFRAGEYEVAIARCRQSLAIDMPEFPQQLNYPILALAYHELGKEDEAKAALKQAAEAMQEWTRQRYEDGPDSWVVSLGAAAIWPVSCWDWLEFEIYFREAHAALGLGPLEDDPRWTVLRARALAGLRRLDVADAEYGVALRVLPDDLQVRLEAHRNRAYYLARLKDFRGSAEEFAKASQVNPDDCRLIAFRALTQLAVGDNEDYCRTCAEMMNRFGDTRDLSVAHELVVACTLHPDALPDMRPLLNVGRLAATKYVGSVRILGAAHYRAGEFAEALACFEEASKINPPGPWALAFQAMVHYRLGQVEKARHHMAEAARWIDEADHPNPNDLTGERATWGGWYEKVNVPIIMREARAMIEPSTDPQARRN